MRDPFVAWLAALSLIAIAYVAWLGRAPHRDLERFERAHVSIQEGDLVFQDLACGPRCDLIRELTGSRYVHVGIVFGEGDARAVWEAFGPVGPTELASWRTRGVDGQIAVYRPWGAPRRALRRVRAELEMMRGRSYDPDYQWDDERIYCSELVAKAFAAAMGRTLWEPGPVDLAGHGALVARMSGGRLTSETPLVTPRALTEHPHFERVWDPLRVSDGGVASATMP